MNIYEILYYKQASDADWPQGVEPQTAWFCPDGPYSHTGKERTIQLFNNEKMLVERVEAYSIPEAFNKFMTDHPTFVVISVSDERTNNPSVAWA